MRIDPDPKSFDEGQGHKSYVNSFMSYLELFFIKGKQEPNVLDQKMRAQLRNF